MKQYMLLNLLSMKFISFDSKEELYDVIAQLQRLDIGFIVLRKYPNADEYTQFNTVT
jgi:hypothetical protein